MDMKISKFDPMDPWYARVDLNEREWPPRDQHGKWMDRPIRQWVYEFCEPGTFFAAAGWILFLKEEDALAFQLTWS
jgi:hypothetical protein